jgi:hypothetical protein
MQHSNAAAGASDIDTEGEGMAGRGATETELGATETAGGAGAAEPEHGCRALSETAETTHLFGSTFDCLTAAVHPQVAHLQYT